MKITALEEEARKYGEDPSSNCDEHPDTDFHKQPDIFRSSSALEGSSPRSVLEIPEDGVDSEHSTSCDSSPVTSCVGSGSQRSRALHWKSIVSSLRKSSWRLLAFPRVIIHDMSKRRLGRKYRSILPTEDELDAGSTSATRKPSWRSFDYTELVIATDNFNPVKLIGKGGHAEVYQGCLPDGQLVAVKRLTKKENEDRVGDFLSELGIIAHIDHANTAKLLGFGIDRGLYLVLQLSSHGSLASMLHVMYFSFTLSADFLSELGIIAHIDHASIAKLLGFGLTGASTLSSNCLLMAVWHLCSMLCSKGRLEWWIRFKVALGVAEGLVYLHRNCHKCVIHRDIKSSNILLGQNYEPQISDFGLAKWLPGRQAFHSVLPIEGTFGYLAPEYFMHGVVDEKTDVFAYGVLLLELITGRQAVDSCCASLVMWAKPLLEKENVKELIDPRLRDEYDPLQMKTLMMAALMCIHHVATYRPYMNQVMKLLKGDYEFAAAT